jgi:hypothetical protein
MKLADLILKRTASYDAHLALVVKGLSFMLSSNPNIYPEFAILILHSLFNFWLVLSEFMLTLIFWFNFWSYNFLRSKGIDLLPWFFFFLIISISPVKTMYTSVEGSPCLYIIWFSLNFSYVNKLCNFFIWKYVKWLKNGSYLKNSLSFNI